MGVPWNNMERNKKHHTTPQTKTHNRHAAGRGRQHKPRGQRSAVRLHGPIGMQWECKQTISMFEGGGGGQFEARFKHAQRHARDRQHQPDIEIDIDQQLQGER